MEDNGASTGNQEARQIIKWMNVASYKNLSMIR